MNDKLWIFSNILQSLCKSHIRFPCTRLHPLISPNAFLEGNRFSDGLKNLLSGLEIKWHNKNVTGKEALDNLVYCLQIVKIKIEKHEDAEKNVNSSRISASSLYNLNL